MEPELALVPIRVAHFAAVLGLLGTVAFRQNMVAPEVAAVLSPLWRGWERWLAGLALVSALAWLAAETALAADGWSEVGDPATLWAVLADTPFGRVWAGRLMLAAVVAGIAVANRDRSRALETGAAGLAASLGWTGHGVMHDGLAGDLAAAGLGLHVLCAGFWVGALPAVLACLLASGRHYALPAAAESLGRFSRAGHVAVAVTVGSGLAVAQSILGTWSLDLSGVYQKLLAAKIVFVALMVLVALVNGYGLMPSLRAGVPETRGRLAALTGLELALAVLVLVLVGDFGNLSPVE